MTGLLILREMLEILVIHALSKLRSINGLSNLRMVMMRKAIKRKSRGMLCRGALLQHDIARPHVSPKKVATIRELGSECLSHPWYIPALAPSDYWLFGEMKISLRGKIFPDFKGLECQINQWGIGTPKEFNVSGLEKLLKRWKLCVDLKGEYIERFDDEFI